MPKSMDFYSLWVVGEMGYDRVDCSTNLAKQVVMQAPKTSLSYRSGSFIPQFILSHQYVNKYNAI